jgi:hypothetical protein
LSFKDRSITSNLHLAPDIKVEKIDDTTVQLADLATVELLSEQCDLRVIHGQQEPLLGWVSFS